MRCSLRHGSDVNVAACAGLEIHFATPSWRTGRGAMQPSIFNLRVPIAGTRRRVSDEHAERRAAARVLGRRGAARSPRLRQPRTTRERERFDLLTRERVLRPEPRGRPRGPRRLLPHASSTASSELHITLLTTLQCNFACGYCYQGDREDFNQFADKMTLETSARVAALDRRRARSPEARNARHHVLRRRAAPESAGDVRHGRAHVARDAGARREADA